MVKEIRLSKGWSQEQLACFSGLSVRTIQRIERGQSTGLESLKCIATTLETDILTIQNNTRSTGNFLGTNPILPVKSVRETASFYKDSLGFEIDILWENPPYAVVARGQVIIEFGEGRKDFAGTGVCNIFVNNVDDIYKELSKKDITFVGDISDREYGNRDFRIRDNNGNMLIFSCPLINQKKLLEEGSNCM
ncbi:glyoxalase superfamily protein [Vibrio sp. 10N.261.55.A7]|uniref:glyoxalase superfamily protein n=1 Tax=Vibrio TaxID=662 RepID=UPI000C85E0A4|nr:glyoxalase superfamily protein [Vibrio sp. 10N.261.55.A7]PMK03991.1 hypothetical protein BCU12_16290 [Vibrio sp. 10N.261.55.A7]